MHHLRSACGGTPEVLQGRFVARKLRQFHISLAVESASMTESVEHLWHKSGLKIFVDHLTIQRCRTPQEYAMAF